MRLLYSSFSFWQMARASSTELQVKKAVVRTAIQVSCHRVSLHFSIFSTSSFDKATTVGTTWAEEFFEPALPEGGGPDSDGGTTGPAASIWMITRSIVKTTSSAAIETSCSSLAACSAP